MNINDLLPILIPGGAGAVGTAAWQVVKFLRGLVFAQIDDLKKKHELDLDALRKGFNADLADFRGTLATFVEENRALRSENTGLRDEMGELRRCVEDREAVIEDLHNKLRQLDKWKNHVTYNNRKRLNNGNY